MAFAAHRARDRGASGDSRSLPEGGRDRIAAAGCVGPATAGKTGQRGDHRVGRAMSAIPDPKRNPETPSHQEQAKTESSKPANGVTTGFGVDLRGSGARNLKPVVCASACEPFREGIELGLRQGRNATAIWQDLVSESGFAGGYQTVKRFVRKGSAETQQPQPRAVILNAPTRPPVCRWESSTEFRSRLHYRLSLHATPPALDLSCSGSPSLRTPRAAASTRCVTSCRACVFCSSLTRSDHGTITFLSQHFLGGRGPDLTAPFNPWIRVASCPGRGEIAAGVLPFLQNRGSAAVLSALTRRCDSGGGRRSAGRR